MKGRYLTGTHPGEDSPHWRGVKEEHGRTEHCLEHSSEEGLRRADTRPRDDDGAQEHKEATADGEQGVEGEEADRRDWVRSNC